MKATKTQPNDERLAKREDPTASAPGYAPPRVEKTQKLAEVTGATKVTGVTEPT